MYTLRKTVRKAVGMQWRI